MLPRPMTDSDRFPAIDDPAMPGGGLPQPRSTPPGDTADNTGAEGEPTPAVRDLDLPGPDDPVAWRYVKEGTAVHGSDGSQIGTVETMLGSDREDIFHGVAVRTGLLSPSRVVMADQIVAMTPSRVEVAVDADALAQAEEYRPVDR